jgi:hypothetical protein
MNGTTMPRKRKSSPDAIHSMGRGPAIERSILSHLLQNEILSGSYSVPSSDQLEQFVKFLNFIRAIYADQILLNSEAGERLSKFWAETIEYGVTTGLLRNALEGAKPTSNSQKAAIQELIKELDDLFKALQKVAQTPILRPNSHEKYEFVTISSISSWANLVAILFREFQKVMSKTKSPPIGISNSGPGVKFLYRIIPLVTGDRPTMGAIAIELKRQMQKQRQPGTKSGGNVPGTNADDA